MVLDSKIAAVREAYSLRDLHDWQDVTPHQVMAIDGVGPVTLDHIRLYLAGHNITLKNDATPTYWKKNLTTLRIAQQSRITTTPTSHRLRSWSTRWSRSRSDSRTFTRDAGAPPRCPDYLAVTRDPRRAVLPADGGLLDRRLRVRIPPGAEVRERTARERSCRSAVDASGSSTSCKFWPGSLGRR